MQVQTQREFSVFTQPSNRIILHSKFQAKLHYQNYIVLAQQRIEKREKSFNCNYLLKELFIKLLELARRKIYPVLLKHTMSILQSFNLTL